MNLRKYVNKRILPANDNERFDVIHILFALNIRWCYGRDYTEQYCQKQSLEWAQHYGGNELGLVIESNHSFGHSAKTETPSIPASEFINDYYYE